MVSSNMAAAAVVVRQILTKYPGLTRKEGSKLGDVVRFFYKSWRLSWHLKVGKGCDRWRGRRQDSAAEVQPRAVLGREGHSHNSPLALPLLRLLSMGNSLRFSKELLMPYVWIEDGYQGGDLLLG